MDDIYFENEIRKAINDKVMEISKPFIDRAVAEYRKQLELKMGELAGNVGITIKRMQTQDFKELLEIRLVL